MKKFKILIGVILSDMGGIIFNTFPMIMLLSVTRFYTGGTPHYSILVVASVLLISLTLFLIPFRLMLMIIQMLNMNLNVYGIFSFAIIGGLTGGSLFHFLIISHFSLNYSNVLSYALLGVIHSIIGQFIYLYIPPNWKIQPFE
jgi:hypothetical protein